MLWNLLAKHLRPLASIADWPTVPVAMPETCSPGWLSRTRHAEISERAVASAVTRQPGVATQLDATGRIPYRLWIGVTGHREPLDDAALSERISHLLQQIRLRSPSSALTPLKFGIVSSLAEGADRLVAKEVLKDRDAVLEAALPLPPEEYVRDFSTTQSRTEFQELLSDAEMIAVMPQSESREAAYSEAGRYLLDRSDVVIALWDGEPSRGVGGTAEIVAEARARGLPLFCIRPSGSYDIYEQPPGRITTTNFHEHDDYNREQIGRQLPKFSSEKSSEWLTAARSVALEDLSLKPALDWILPYLGRADILARRYQRRFFMLGRALFLIAFLAVALAAFERIFMPDRPQIGLLEFALLLVLVLALLYGRHRRVQQRWIAYRSLAERLRIAFFLSFATWGRTRIVTLDGDRTIDAGNNWIRRAWEEVWMRRPPHARARALGGSTKRFFANAWIGSQLDYYRRASQRHSRQDRLLTHLSWILFSFTLLAALFDGIGVFHDLSQNLVLLAAASLPALAAAFSGIRAEREYVRNAERFRRLARDLEAVRVRMDRATDDQVVRALAKAAEAVMLEEHRDWFGLMRFHDLELHT